jgi:hypothetical protein
VVAVVTVVTGECPSDACVCLCHLSTAGCCEQRNVSTRQPQAPPCATGALPPTQPSLTTGMYSVDLHALQHESTASDVTLHVVRVRACWLTQPGSLTNMPVHSTKPPVHRDQLSTQHIQWLAYLCDGVWASIRMGAALVAHRPAAELAGSRDNAMCPGTARLPVTASIFSDNTTASLHVEHDVSVKRRHTLQTEHGQEVFPKTLHRKDASQTGVDANVSTNSGITKAPDARRRGADSLPSLC